MCSMVIGQSKEIIGTPFKIENLEVAQYDFPNEMEWFDAVKVCANLGSNWRLPTKDELSLLYNNKDKIGGFASDYYWSSTEEGSDYAWWQDFAEGLQIFFFKDDATNVRAVRTIN